ncbi:ABC-type xylose transport system, substrate-binding protein [Microbacterium hydrothermale]|uniref:substrate-binding domain-containing protein n=1 Tax=Microbacterium hydrothermale TaxID=857427 RepID=UPI0022262C84|nr:substrate-binding domain-containing protein [Microbacterium hydrothermale]MCW2165639.1 ABC-type xylose transport system, substrate-binding protein [Microbacterium hydrothermale]
MTRSHALRAAAALLALTLGLAACAPAQGSAAGSSDGSSDGAGVVGVALPTTADALWSRGGDALRRELVVRGYRVDLQFAASDPRTQAAQVQNMLTKSADAVVVAPWASEELAPALAVAADDGVPVVAFGPSPTDAADLGRAQAEALLADLADAPSAAEPSPEATPTTTASEPTPSGDASPDAVPGTDGVPGAAAVRLAVLAAGVSDEGERSRYEAALATLQSALDAGRLEIVSGATLEAAEVGADTAESRASAAEERLRDLRAGAADEAPTAVLALGDAVTRGVVTALTTTAPTTEAETASPTPTPATTAAAVAPAPLVVGSGADPVTVRALRDGAIDATTFVDPRALVPATADLVEALLAGDDTASDETPDVSPSILRADDVEELVASGWISTDEL